MIDPDKYQIPAFGNFDDAWDTTGWTEIKIDSLATHINDFGPTSLGRIVEHHDCLLFEDARDATMFTLGLKK